ncbi:MAG: YggS family pyridoxal phosphate-dependent enzyme [Acidimicrobiia bacterium]|nr:YggS family pyridoxal phosphate-dependent enzyme [Acidimicrobiia bacterium]
MAASALEIVLERIAVVSSSVGRSSDDITLIAISKGRTVSEIMEVYAQGHREFGENRAQELAEKAPLLPDDIRWHFVGPLQRNKVSKVRGTLLHSLDREALARAWGSAPALVQVNTGEEPQKHGVAPAAAIDFIDMCVGLGVEVRGLMAMAPRVSHPEQAAPFFRSLRELRDEAVVQHPAVRELSMGMTEDFETAIAEGATMLRLGRAIFGTADYQ